MEHVNTEEQSGSAAAHASARRPLGVRFLVVLVALLPVAGMLAVAIFSAQRSAAERDAADRLREDTRELVAVIDARVAAANEEVASSVLAIAADLGVDAEALSELYDTDFVGQLEAARAAVDASTTLAQIPELADELEVFLGLRDEIDAGTLTFAAHHGAAQTLTRAIDEVWSQRYVREVRERLSDNLPAEAHARLEALNVSYLLRSAGADRAALTSFVLIGEPTAQDLANLVDATGFYNSTTPQLASRLGPKAAEAWEDFLARPETVRFVQVLDDALAATLAGEESPLSADPTAFGRAYIDGPLFASGLTDVVKGAADDLREIAAEHSADASSDLRVQVAVVALLAVASLGIALFAGARLVGPVQQLEGAAQQIHEGRFDLPSLEVTGPRELADTARAFNDMASTLAAIEDHAVALADDPDSPVLTEPLPGRTGRALQVALNRLRNSMLAAEEHRRDLEQAATHDGLTGLLNRSAAFEVLSKELSLAQREGSPVMALFIDLDNLKTINDEHGHAAGDDAVRLTAEALQESTRAADVVARLGGDEFLVAGIFHDGPGEVEEVAERIRRSVSTKVVRTLGAEVTLHCSIGIGVAPPSGNLQALISHADAAMYLAKRRGRDQVAWYEDSETDGAPDEGGAAATRAAT